MKYITGQFSKYLVKLREEISLYKNEANLWKLTPGILNTPGNLALHLCGNLKHNIGAVIGETGYIRNRDNEFAVKNVPKDEIITEIDSTIDTVLHVLENLSAEDYIKAFPESSHGEEQTYIDALIRLSFHFAYHTGQINYHRRILEG
jgi:hypothetical protein